MNYKKLADLAIAQSAIIDELVQNLQRLATSHAQLIDTLTIKEDENDS